MRVLLLWLTVLQMVYYVCLEYTDENFKVLYDKSFNLTCEGKDFNISTLPILEKPHYFFWILPNGEYLGSDSVEPHENDRVIISGTGYDYGKILHIKRADDPDYGIYNCLIKTVGGNYKLAIRKGINVDGPYYGDLMEKYRENIIIGVCAGGGLLVICILGCLVYHLRFRHNEEDDDSIEEELNGKPTKIHGYDNYASEIDEQESSTTDRYTEIHVENGTADLQEDTTKL